MITRIPLAEVRLAPVLNISGTFSAQNFATTANRQNLGAFFQILYDGRACKPDSVGRKCVLTIIPLGRSLRNGSSSLPEGCSRLQAYLSRRCLRGSSANLRLLRSASRAGSPLLFGLAPRGVFLASPVARRAVGSYPTVSPLPAKAPLKDDEQVPLPPVTAANFRGGLFSVALSVTQS